MELVMMFLFGYVLSWTLCYNSKEHGAVQQGLRYTCNQNKLKLIEITYEFFS